MALTRLESCSQPININTNVERETIIVNPYQSYTKPFLKVFLSALEDLASNEELTAFYRLHLLALARARPNGHAEFKRGALTKLVGRNGKRHHDLESAIQQAVKRSLLHPASMPTCLVLPTGLAEPYARSGENARHFPCRTHTGRPKPVRTAACHPDRKHKAHDLCDSCYRSEKRLAAAMGREPSWVFPSMPAGAEEVGEKEGEFAA
ncbi:hypothetical protein ACQI4F_05795 [Mycolicibacterium vaccae]|uniref:hypothetical protein n=1 Tax=Mycolicibacterium vaccae TaxID=1810 RepID=UPI003CF1BF49